MSDQTLRWLTVAFLALGIVNFWLDIRRKSGSALRVLPFERQA